MGKKGSIKECGGFRSLCGPFLGAIYRGGFLGFDFERFRSDFSVRGFDFNWRWPVFVRVRA